MGLIRFNGIMDAIDEQFADSAGEVPPDFVVVADGHSVRMSPREAREAVRGSERDGLLAEAVWRHAVRAAQGSAGSDPVGRPWALFVVWLVLPRLRSVVFRVTSRLPVDRRDVEAEGLLGVVEALGAADAETPGVDDVLVRAAANRMWSFARSAARETSVADVAGLAARRGRGDPAAGAVDEKGWEVHITPPGGPDGLSGVLRFTESRTQREGERLGALAEWFGLRHVVHRARRSGRARVGTVSLRHRGGEAW